MKRFTETDKWRDPWFRKLTGPAKLLWFYLIDNADNIGLVDLDMELVSMDCGMTIETKHLLELGDRVQPLGNGKHFLTKFITFQYGKPSSSCPAHKRVIQAMEQHGVEENGNGYAYPSARVAIPYRKGKERNVLDIEELWQAFPATSRTRSSKKDLRDALDKAGPLPPMDELVAHAKKWAECHEWTRDGGQFAPGCHRWVKARKWESEPEAAKIVSKTRPINEQFNYAKHGTSTTRPLFD